MIVCPPALFLVILEWTTNEVIALGSQVLRGSDHRPLQRGHWIWPPIRYSRFEQEYLGGIVPPGCLSCVIPGAKECGFMAETYQQVRTLENSQSLAHAYGVCVEIGYPGLRSCWVGRDEAA